MHFLKNVPHIGPRGKLMNGHLDNNTADGSCKAIRLTNREQDNLGYWDGE
jgi:hypothetical protein